MSGFPNLGGLGNMNNLMKQAQQLQKDMKDAKSDLESMTFVGHSTKDYVTVKMTGNHRVTDLEIKPEVIDPDDSELLADLILTAVNDCLSKIDAESEQKLGKYTKGLGL